MMLPYAVSELFGIAIYGETEEGYRLDEYDFYRQSVMLICGSLRVEESLHGWLRLVGSVMPADRAYLQLYEPSLSAMRTIAMATPESSEELDLLTMLS